MAKILLFVGKGYPKYLAEDQCSYLFEWSTKYACIEPVPECRLANGKQIYDLTPLTRDDDVGKKI